MFRQKGKSNRISCRASRRGVVLYIVVTIVLLMSLITYALLIAMRDQNLAAALSGDRLQARQAALSAQDLFASMLEESRLVRDAHGGLDLNPDRFSQIPLVLSQSDFDDELPFAFILRPDFELFQFGAVNESGKIHLQNLLETDQQLPGWGRATLMRLPGMTETIADHILDWIDLDDEAREFGNESNFYVENFGYPTRNGIPPVLDELLQIPGVTRTQLLGTNFDFGDERTAPDQNETRFQTNEPTSRPWINYLTVHSEERNESYSGEPRINLNQPDLFSLHQSLVQNLDLEIANFIILYRQHSPTSSETLRKDLPADSQLPTDMAINFGEAGLRKIETPLELVNATIEISKGEDEILTVKSPLQIDDAGFMEKLSKLLDFCTLTKQKSAIGRVNIGVAPREVLLSVPGLDDSIVDRIIEARRSELSNHSDISWLLSERVLSLETFGTLASRITMGGDVYRARFAGYADSQTAPFVFESVLNAAGNSTMQLEFKRLNQTLEFIYKSSDILESTPQ